MFKLLRNARDVIQAVRSLPGFIAQTAQKDGQSIRDAVDSVESGVEGDHRFEQGTDCVCVDDQTVEEFPASVVAGTARGDEIVTDLAHGDSVGGA